jgi:hypothetical protein
VGGPCFVAALRLPPSGFGRWLNLPPSFRGEEWKLLGALPTGDSALGEGGSLVCLAKGAHVE